MDPTTEQLFDDAFAEAASEAAPAELPATRQVIEPAPAEIVPSSEVVPAAAPAEVVPSEPSAAEAAPAATIPDAPAEDPALEQLRRERDELQRKLDERNRPPEPEPEPATEARPEPEPALSKAEQDQVKQYRDDWPDVANAEELLRKQMAAELRTEVYTAVGTVLQQMFQMMSPLLNKHQGDLMSSRDTAIIGAHADYPAIKAGLTDWVNKQPAGLSTSYKQILDKGSADDVISIVSLYKQVVGKTAPQATPTTTPPIPAAPALEVVSTGRRTAPIQGAPDMNDFTGAFKEFAG